MIARTIAELAAELIKSPHSLLDQLRCAGVEKDGPEASWTPLSGRTNGHVFEDFLQT